MRILVLRGGALGDFLVTLPALGLLRARWPEARIELAGNAAAAAVAVGRHYLDAAHAPSEARWSRLGSGGLRAGEPLGAWLAGFDLVVNFWPDADGALARDFRELGFSSRGSRRLLTHPAMPEQAPAAAHFCAALAPLDLGPGNLAARVFPTAADRARAATLVGHDDRRLVAWHPGSGSYRKNWPLAAWLEVIEELLRRESLRLAVLLGEAEAGMEREAGLLDRLPPDTVVLRYPGVEVLAAVLERCSLFLGHDSGPSHLAAAAGCPCVLVFGPTDPAMWAPPHPHVRVARRGADVGAVSVADVLSLV